MGRVGRFGAVLVAASFLAGGCGDGGSAFDQNATTSSSSGTGSTAVGWSALDPIVHISAERLQVLESSITFGEMAEVDSDGDGASDQFVQRYPTRAVAEGVTLQRTLDYARTPEGQFAGTLVLRFEIDPTRAVSYRHVVEVDKSFAPSIDDLIFSIPPSEVIDPDPVWAQEVNYQPGTSAPEDATVQVRVESTVTQPSPEAVRNSAETDAVLEAVDACRRRSNQEEQLVCLLNVILEYPDNPVLQQILAEAVPADPSDPFSAMVQAVSELDMAACDRLPAEGAIVCQTFVVRAVFQSCGRVPDDERLPCFRSAWSEVSEPEFRRLVCQHLADLALQAECLGRGSIDVCSEYEEGAARIACIVMHAVAAADPLLCERLQSQGGQGDLDWCLSEVAAAAGELDACVEIADRWERLACVAQIATARGDIGICERLGEPDLRERCYASVAAETGDVAACLRVNSHPDPDNRRVDEQGNWYTADTSYERDLCIVTAIRKSAITDPAWCDHVLDLDGFGARQRCLAMVAVNARDPDICSRIPDAAARTGCLALIAAKTVSLEICDRMEDPSDRDNCRAGVCEIATDPETRRRCQEEPDGGILPSADSVRIEVSWADPDLVAVRYEVDLPGQAGDGWYHGCTWPGAGGQEARPLELNSRDHPPGEYTLSAYFVNWCVDYSDAGAENPDPYGAFDAYPQGSVIAVTARVSYYHNGAITRTDSLSGDVVVDNSGQGVPITTLGTVTLTASS